MNIKCKFYEGNLWKSGKRRSTLREVFSFANAINLKNAINFKNVINFSLALIEQLAKRYDEQVVSFTV